jgi:hypothetical protein
MDLQELAQRTEIPIRRLRHCLDEGLVPGLRTESHAEIGRRRRFHEDAGFALCCAATLVTAGIDRSMVRLFLGGIARVNFRKTATPVIVVIFKRQAESFAELADNANLRVKVEAPWTFDTGWRPLNPGDPPDGSYQPRTTIGLNLGAIGKEVFKW